MLDLSQIFDRVDENLEIAAMLEKICILFRPNFTTWKPLSQINHVYVPFSANFRV